MSSNSIEAVRYPIDKKGNGTNNLRKESSFTALDNDFMSMLSQG